jgi:hypothetical protein
VNTAPNTTIYGGWVNLGRRGLPQGSQFIVNVDGPAGVSGDNPTVEFELQLTLDNNATRHGICSFKIDPSEAHEGRLVRDIAQDFNVQEYAAANVDVRLAIIPVSDNVSNNVTAVSIGAYLGSGEKQVFGRLPGADTLFVHP